jgi:acetyl esterase/lipase
MTKRNFSMQAYWDRKAADWQPRLSFRCQSQQDWPGWHAEALARLRDLMGDWPDPVDLNPEVEYCVTDGDLIRERIVLDTEAGMSVPCLLVKPKDMPSDKQQAAILCSHGHGRFGKDPVAGIRSSAGHIADIEQMNYNYAEQMARAGYLTLAPDLRVFGERRDGENPFPGRDPCNVNYIKGSIMGVYPLTLNVWDMMRCIDYLQTRPEVDPQRIGMMGLSQGGTMTTFTTALEPRIKVADIIGYVNPWSRFGISCANFCGSQVVPQIYRYFDTSDIAGLIAPRPLLIEMGIYDDCFPIQDQVAGFAGVQEIYQAACAETDLWQDIHPGPHAFAGNKAFAFFKRYL